jgi:hypothetical protein
MDFIPTHRFNTDKITLDTSDAVIPKGLSRDYKMKLFQEIITQRQLDLFGLNLKEFRLIQSTNANWEKEYVLTHKQYKDLTNFAIKLLKRLFRWNKKICSREWSWFALNNTLSVREFIINTIDKTKKNEKENEKEN